MAKQDAIAPQREPRPEWRYLDRLSSRTEDGREAAFQSYLETTVAYFKTVEAAGDTPWFSTVEERSELYMRRFERPAPPEGVPVRALAEIRGDAATTTTDHLTYEEIEHCSTAASATTVGADTSPRTAAHATSRSPGSNRSTGTASQADAAHRPALV